MRLGIGIGRAGGGGHGSDTAPQWPPAGALHIHPNMTWDGGDPNDVRWIEFESGLRMLATGTGAPITKDADGFHFNLGQYFSYTPTVVTEFSAVAAFAKITFPAIPQEGIGDLTQRAVGDKSQMPINMIGVGESLMSLRKRHLDMYCDTGSHCIRAGWLQDDIGRVDETKTLNLGVHLETNPEFQEDPGGTVIWMNNRVLLSGVHSETLKPTEWQVGKDMYGTMHEGVVMIRPVGLLGPLYPPGVRSRWLCDQLAA